MTATEKPLSVRRAADRKRMAAEIEKLVTEMGCTFERREGGEYPGPHCIQVQVQAPRGLQVTVSFDSKSWQPDVYVLSWHMATRATATLDPGRFGGDVNPYHFQKATYVACGFEELCDKLRIGLGLAVSGRAFREHEEPAAQPPRERTRA